MPKTMVKSDFGSSVIFYDFGIINGLLSTKWQSLWYYLFSPNLGSTSQSSLTEWGYEKRKWKKKQQRT